MSNPKDCDWFKAEKTEVRGYFMKAPYDKIFIGCRPTEGMRKEEADAFDAIINVSTDPFAVFYPSRPDQRTYWYPVVEPGRWSLGYLQWIVRVMDFHYDQGHQIYLHCSAGAFRSPSAAVLWLQSRGFTHEEATNLCKESHTDGWLSRHWEHQGNLPYGWEDLLKILRANPGETVEALEYHGKSDPFDRELYNGWVRRQKLKRHFFPWWYRLKYGYRELRDRVGYFLKNQGYKREGACTYTYPRKVFWTWPKDAQPLKAQDYQASESRWSEDKNKWVKFRKWDREKIEWVEIPEEE